MKVITIQGVQVEIDEDKTQSLNDIHTDWCQCDGCTSRRIAFQTFTPPELAEILQPFGFSLRPVTNRWHGRTLPKDPPGTSRIHTYWLLSGRIIGANRTPNIPIDDLNWAWIDTERRGLNAFNSQVEDLVENDPSIIFLIVSNPLPRLVSQLTTFRSYISVDPCPQCGSEHKMTGYLKRNSLIPRWLKDDEMQRILDSRKARIRMMFCAICGHVSSEVVTRKPWFNGLLVGKRQLNKRRRAFWKASHEGRMKLTANWEARKVERSDGRPPVWYFLMTGDRSRTLGATFKAIKVEESDE